MKKDISIEIIKKLIKAYPEAKCSLDFKTPFEMMIAVMLSAQCTDERVNLTTPSLFAKYNTPEKMANAPIEELEMLVHPCGFYKNKAKNMKLASQKLLNDFDGEVPHTMEDLITIPGVGRKSANVIMLEAFDNPQGIAVDTHVKRISNRIGLSKQSEPEKIEQDLLKALPKEYYKDVNHVLIYHGRSTCTARNPKCSNCPIFEICERNLK